MSNYCEVHDMAAGNNVELTGNITSDIELRVTNNGTAVAQFGLAWNRRWQHDGEWQEEAHFFDVTVFGEQAENVTDSLRKGDRVMISGRLDQNRWEDKETGQNRSKVVLVADEVAASLRWATAEVAKKEREQGGRGAGGGGGRGRGRDDYNDRGGRDGGRDSGGRGRYDDEVPF